MVVSAVDNQRVGDILDEIGDMLDIQSEISFKVQAYHRAANAIRSFPEDINKVWRENRLKDIRGVGKSIAEKVEELLGTGRLIFYEELKEKVPPSLLDLMQVPGVGPKKAKIFYEELGVTTIEELLNSIEAHRIAPLRGMGAKTEENILRGIQLFQRSRERILLFEAHSIAEKIVNDFRKYPFVKGADMAGSLRRMKETIGDIDILVGSDEPLKVAEVFCHLPEVAQVLAKGETKCSVVTKSGLQVDLRVVASESYGAALQYFTGSKEHNIRLREIAKKKGLKISEYGIFEVATGRRLGGEREEDIYRVLGLDYMPPTLRENKGEVEAALEHRLPNLIELRDIRGDLHVHSIWSDGSNRIEQLVEEALKLDYEYLGLCDHAVRLKVAGGMELKDVERRLEEIREVNEKNPNFTVLNGVELNIENDGAVDYPEEVLAQFDLVTASIHWGFGQSKEQLTRRLLKAMENPYIHAISHPTGRILGKRDPYPLDMELVFKVAAETETFLELNSFPDRLDLKDDHLKQAKEEFGCKFIIGTDAHGTGQLPYIRYGVVTAQRGWLESKDVLNTYPIDRLMKVLRK